MQGGEEEKWTWERGPSIFLVSPLHRAQRGSAACSLEGCWTFGSRDKCLGALSDKRAGRALWSRWTFSWALKNELDFKLKTFHTKGPSGPRPSGRHTWGKSVGLRLGSGGMRLEMPPRGQMAEGGGSILYFASDLLNVPEPITGSLLCLSFPWISLGLQAPGSHSKAVLRWKVSRWGGFSGHQDPGLFFLPPELDSWPRTLLLDPGHLWLGEWNSNLGGLPGVSPIKIKGISAPWDRPT